MKMFITIIWFKLIFIYLYIYNQFAGWAAGISIFAFCCLITNYTAKLLGRLLEADPESRTFGDLAGAAYGMRGRIFVTALFITELISNR